MWPTIRHTLFWIVAVHGPVDQERSSEDSRNMRCTMASRQSFALATRPSCLPTLRWRPVGKAASFILPTKPPCSARVDVLETGNVPIFFSLGQMKHLGMTVELDPKGDKITCPAFGLYSSPAEYSTVGHTVTTKSITEIILRTPIYVARCGK